MYIHICFKHTRRPKTSTAHPKAVFCSSCLHGPRGDAALQPRWTAVQILTKLNADPRRWETEHIHRTHSDRKMSHSNLLLLIRSATSVTLSSIYSWSQFSKSAENRWISPAFVAFKWCEAVANVRTEFGFLESWRLDQNPSLSIFTTNILLVLFLVFYTLQKLQIIFNEWRGRPTVN